MDGPHVTYCVLTSAEQQSFPRVWHVDSHRVKVARWPYTLNEEVVAHPQSMDGTVFAGGDSMRDYGPLLAIAAQIPVQITIASRRLTPRQIAEAPPNVQAGPLSQVEYDERLARASIVVVPMRAGLLRGAGQTTYINAMAVGKLVIVSDAPGVLKNVKDRVTGLVIPPGQPEALADALRWATAPERFRTGCNAGACPIRRAGPLQP